MDSGRFLCPEFNSKGSHFLNIEHFCRNAKIQNGCQTSIYQKQLSYLSDINVNWHKNTAVHNMNGIVNACYN